MDLPPLNPEQNEALNNYRFYWLERRHQRREHRQNNPHLYHLTVQDFHPLPNQNQLIVQINEMEQNERYNDIYKRFYKFILISLIFVSSYLVIVLLLFGRGKIPQLMGDMAKGINSFKKGMTDEEKKEDNNIEKKTDEDK